MPACTTLRAQTKGKLYPSGRERRESPAVPIRWGHDALHLATRGS